MKEQDEALARALAERAAGWRARHREGPLTSTERREFTGWLRESPAHVAAYLEVARLEDDVASAARDWAGAFRPLEADRPGDVVVALRASSPVGTRPGPRRRGIAVLTAAAMLAAVAVSSVLVLNDGQRFGLRKVYETAHAEQGSWPLPDGSVLHLNSDSRAVVRFGADERLVSVERGQAMSQVAKERARRFRVDAGDMQVIAVGTAFDVYRRAQGTRVVVLEGRVAVVRAGAASGTPGRTAPRATPLAAGQQLETAAGTAPPQIVPADLRRARAWLQREIVLDASPLVEVVEDFNRYSSVPIEIEGDELKTLEISGVFGAYDIESLVEFLRRLEGVRVEETQSRIRIFPARPPAPETPALVGTADAASAPADAREPSAVE